MNCTLRKVDDAEDWHAYHGIRRRVLFEERGRFGVYNNNHPDELRAGNTPFLLITADRPIGTVRVDLRNRHDAIVRMVAISNEERGKGHGRCLMQLVAEFALSSGRTRLVLNAAPEAVAFYRKLGFNEEVWDDEELKSVLAGGAQMTKKIGV
jgi:GNAT superfamily N-acetyltransferase